ncbi:hypothetical protein HS961_09830 [Comamonas piscis]|uniref:Uncharacterized protein n=1 Tax=Comamonas piscis TaxID=1562974 RepID=A0A7G5EGI6_9BURK|nr:hypothetical protein [Comamonas piscis]QMV73111.1 hypothetical protein HS961_09830 [Comamonas piscis]WSO35898.1 hypothetical protein VUJ63_09860 [Comamonas piscis]
MQQFHGQSFNQVTAFAALAAFLPMAEFCHSQRAGLRGGIGLDCSIFRTMMGKLFAALLPAQTALTLPPP